MKRILSFLLTDDDKDDRSLFKIALNSVDPEANYYAAREGKEALELLSKLTGNLPDVIFMDINMPEYNGWEFLKSFKENSSFGSVPVIMYSTSSHKRDIELAKKLGAVSFCTKPDDFDDLKLIIQFVADNLRNNTLREALNSDQRIRYFK